MGTFDPEHKKFTIPEGVKEGDTQKLALDDGRFCIYTLPKGTQPGEVHIIRADSGTKKIMLRIEKADVSTKLGITLTSKGNEKHPVCSDIAADGAAAGTVEVGDVILSVSVDQPVAKKIEATAHEQTSELLRSSSGLIRIEVMRPTPAPPNRVLAHGFLYKRSPKSLINVHAWQSRWFELSPVRCCYHAPPPRARYMLERGTYVRSLAKQPGGVHLAPLIPHRRASRTGSWRCAVRTPRRSRAPSSPSSSASRRALVLGAALEPIDRTRCSRHSESTAS